MSVCVVSDPLPHASAIEALNGTNMHTELMEGADGQCYYGH